MRNKKLLFSIITLMLLFVFFKPAFTQEAERVLVFNFVVKGDYTSSINLTEKFVEYLKQRNKMEIVDLEERNRTLYENKLLPPANLNDEYVKKACAILNASKYILPLYTKTDEGYTVKVKIVDIQSSEEKEFERTFAGEEEADKHMKNLTFKVFDMPVIGKIEVNTEPSSADLFLEGDLEGKTPVVLEDLTTREYTLTVYKKDHKLHTEKVLIDEDNLDVKLSVKLESQPSKTKKEKLESYFRKIESGTDKGLSDICRYNNNTYFIVGEKGTILVSKDGGKTWGKVDCPTDKNLLYIEFINENLGWITGEKGCILHTNDAGKTWTEQESGVKRNLSDIHFVDDKTGWIVGGTQKSYFNAYGGGGLVGTLLVGIFNATSQSVGIILKTEDGGNSWERLKCPVSQPINSIYFKDKDNGWAVGGEGTILRTKDAGLTWEKMHSPTTLTLDDICFTKDGTGYINGGFYYVENGHVYSLIGILLKSENGGSYWEYDNIFSGYLTTLSAHDDDDYAAVETQRSPSKVETYINIKSSLADSARKKSKDCSISDAIMTEPYKVITVGSKGSIFEYFDPEKENVYVSYNTAEEKNYTKAISQIKKNIELDPGYMWTYLYLGQYYDGANQKDKAVKCYRKFIGEDPYSDDALYARDRIIELAAE
ncbi:MAG: YCF48-related protein [Armatimonadota bacterium]